MIRRLVLMSLVMSPCLSLGQERNAIQKAMQDELKRSLLQLRLDSLKRPFYISYTINDVKLYTVVATLGALVNSIEIPSRTKGLRVLAGSYEFNDESLDNNLFSSPEANEIDLPLDDDYIGIRRSLWVTTDKVYRDAARQLEKNSSMLKDQKKSLAEIPHRTFAKTPAVQITTDWTPIPFDKTKWEQNLRQLSARFVEGDEPASSMVLNFVQGYEYFVNSEGTSIKVPLRTATLQVFAQSKNADGEIVFDQVTWRGHSPDDFPPLAQLDAEITSLLKRMEEMKHVKSFNDEYTGPLLIEGGAVADVFANTLFMGREQLLVDNNIPSLSGYRADRSASLESRIGKIVAATNLTVKDASRLKKYKGTDLLGSFEADPEGVVPPEELVLIDKGVLKNLLNDRTITSPTQTPNGHSAGAGVVVVSLEGAVTQKELKAKLIEQAKAQGLEYAMIIRNHLPGGIGLFNVYKVNLTNGEEEILRLARFSSLALKNLKKLTGSTEEAVYHLQSNGNSGAFTSYIVPQAMLMGEVDIQHAEMPVFKEEEVVKSPLKKE